VLVASGSDVLRMSTDHVGGPVDDVIYSSSEGGDVTAISYDSVTGKLYMAVASYQDADDSYYISSAEILRPASDVLSSPQYDSRVFYC